MEKVYQILNKFLGKILLKRPTLLGLDEQTILLIIGPTMKIFVISAYPPRLKKKFPFNEKRILRLSELKQWAIDNGYKVEFKTQNPKIKKKITSVFGDSIVETNTNTTKPPLDVLVLEELKKSELPESLKKWADKNPEKFIKNIKHVQNLLRK